MPFVWTSGVDSLTANSSVILASHTAELRTNTDWIKDNLACITDKAGTHFIGEKASHCKADHSTHKATYESDNKSAPHFSDDKGFNMVSV
jgi:hypothetical protein